MTTFTPVGENSLLDQLRDKVLEYDEEISSFHKQINQVEGSCEVVETDFSKAENELRLKKDRKNECAATIALLNNTARDIRQKQEGLIEAVSRFEGMKY